MRFDDVDDFPSLKAETLCLYVDEVLKRKWAH
jgi:hypothetical protein